MKGIVFILVLSGIFFTNASFALLFTESELSRMVVAIRFREGTSMFIGTGLIVSNSEGKFGLITADHVIANRTGNCSIIFNEDGKAKEIPLNILNPSPMPWRSLFLSDIAIMDVFPEDPNVLKFIKSNNFPTSQIIRSEAGFDRGTEVKYFGYPALPDVIDFFSPIIIKTELVSTLITSYRYDGKGTCNFQFVANPIMGGFSGGPVFIGAAPDNDGIVAAPWDSEGKPATYLIGIMHGTAGDALAKLGAVTPSYYIFKD